MATKKPAKTTEAPAVPKNARGVKTKERAAVESMGGVVDESIPGEKVLQVLGESKYQGNPDAVLQAVCMAMGMYRMSSGIRKHALTPKEVALQAAATRDAADVMSQMLTFVSPKLEAITDPILWKSTGEHLYSLQQRLLDDLYRLQALMQRAMEDLEKQGTGKPGSRPDWARAAALETVTGTVVRYAKPAMKPSPARLLAADLLRAAGLPLPNDEREIRRLSRTSKVKNGGK